MKIEVETNSNSFMSIMVSIGEGEVMSNNETKQGLYDKARVELDEQEYKIFQFLDKYLEKAIKDFENDYNAELNDLKKQIEIFQNLNEKQNEQLDKIKEYTIEDLEREARLKGIYKIIDDIFDMKSRYRLNELEQMGDEYKQEYMDYFEFVLKEIKNLQPNVYEKFKDNFNENGKLKDMTLMNILLESKKLRYFLRNYMDSRVFATGKIWQKMKEIDERLKTYESREKKKN